MNTTIALVTGASSGIGKEFARLVAQDGFNIVLTARDKLSLIELKDELSKHYPQQKFIVIAADLAKPGIASKLYKTVASKYDIELLINSAGFGDYTPLAEQDEATITAMIDLNVTALTELSRLAAEDMTLRHGGHILNVASVAAFFPGPFMAVYYATKAYVLSFTEALAEEVAEANVVVTALCPGPTQSNFDTEAKTKGKGAFKNPDKLPTAADVAGFGYEALVARKVVAIYGRSSKFGVFMTRLLPRSVVRKLVKKRQQP